MMLCLFRILLILSVCLPMLAMAESWQAQSGEKQLAVIELFTSEGCGLCPPADRWVHELPEQGVSDDKLIVLGFHIDYLNDKKGWVDKFAKPLFSERQRQLAKLNLYQTVFTPEFFISGEVVHNWREHGIEVIDFVNSFEPQADISLHAARQKQALTVNTTVVVRGEDNRHYTKLYLALTEDNVVSHIFGGDNAGATFNHQHLVRGWHGPFALELDGDTELKTIIELQPEWNLQNLKLVALVQNLDDGFVLQGLSLPLPTE